MRRVHSPAVLVLAAILASNCGSTVNGPPAKALGDACSMPEDCGDGLACVGRQCAKACTSDSACSAGEHCARVPTVPPTQLAGCVASKLRRCADSECSFWGEVCFQGYCRAPVLDAPSCHLDEAGNDGCGPNAICLDFRYPGRAPACYHLTPCSEGCGGTPPLGVCNDGRLSTKSEGCLPGLCLTNADCYQSACLKDSASDPFGRCLVTKGMGFGSASGAQYVWATGFATDAEMCPTSDVKLSGTHAAGEFCASFQECAPTCCDCAAGGAVLAAGCFHAVCGETSAVCAAVKDRCGHL